MGVEPIIFPVYKTGALPIVRHRRNPAKGVEPLPQTYQVRVLPLYYAGAIRLRESNPAVFFLTREVTHHWGQAGATAPRF